MCIHFELYHIRFQTRRWQIGESRKRMHRAIFPRSRRSELQPCSGRVWNSLDGRSGNFSPRGHYHHGATFGMLRFCPTTDWKQVQNVPFSNLHPERLKFHYFCPLLKIWQKIFRPVGCFPTHLILLSQSLFLQNSMENKLRFLAFVVIVTIPSKIHTFIHDSDEESDWKILIRFWCGNWEGERKRS